MRYTVLFIYFLLATQLVAQDVIRKENLVKHVEFLASDELGGRWPGSAGDTASRQYIISNFKAAGMLPAFAGGYEQAFQPTIFLEAPIKENFVKTVSDVSLMLNREYGIFPFSGRGKVNAPVIIASQYQAAFRALQVHKKSWVLVWRQKGNVPATDSLSDYALAMQAVKMGAAGVIMVNPDSLDSKDVLVKLRPRKDAPLPVPVLQLKRNVLENLVNALGIKPATTQAGDSCFITKKPLKVSVWVQPVMVSAVNIAGIIPGNDPQLKNEYIILGAHYDHLGLGGYGTGSLKPDTTAIHNGADDNASGTAALLEISRVLAQNRQLLKRSVLVVAFGAEEEGLLGSEYFVNHLPVPDSSVRIMLNMDMVGRLNNENNLYMGGAGTFPGGAEFMKSLESGSGLSLLIHQGGVGGSDHVSFYKKGFSCIGFHTGGHPQYHTPEDDAAFINADGIEKVAKYIYSAVVGLCNRNEAWGFINRDSD